ncbi:phosphatidylserine decarboxylase [Balamuthia mandrillaris]
MLHWQKKMKELNREGHTHHLHHDHHHDDYEEDQEMEDEQEGEEAGDADYEGDQDDDEDDEEGEESTPGSASDAEAIDFGDVLDMEPAELAYRHNNNEGDGEELEEEGEGEGAGAALEMDEDEFLDFLTGTTRLYTHLKKGAQLMYALSAADECWSDLEDEIQASSSMSPTEMLESSQHTQPYNPQKQQDHNSNKRFSDYSIPTIQEEVLSEPEAETTSASLTLTPTQSVTRPRSRSRVAPWKKRTSGDKVPTSSSATTLSSFSGSGKHHSYLSDSGEQRNGASSMKLKSTKNGKQQNGNDSLGVLKLTVLEGRKFPKNLKGPVSPFVVVEFGDLRKETKPVRRNRTPKWNKTLHIPVKRSLVDEKITFSVFDYQTTERTEKVPSTPRKRNWNKLRGKGRTATIGPGGSRKSKTTDNVVVPRNNNRNGSKPRLLSFGRSNSTRDLWSKKRAHTLNNSTRGNSSGGEEKNNINHKTKTRTRARSKTRTEGDKEDIFSEREKEKEKETEPEKDNVTEKEHSESSIEWEIEERPTAESTANNNNDSEAQDAMSIIPQLSITPCPSVEENDVAQQDSSSSFSSFLDVPPASPPAEQETPAPSTNESTSSLSPSSSTSSLASVEQETMPASTTNTTAKTEAVLIGCRAISISQFLARKEGHTSEEGNVKHDLWLNLSMLDAKGFYLENMEFCQIHVQTEFIPTPELQVLFWRECAKLFDTGGEGRINYWGIIHLLDALGIKLNREEELQQLVQITLFVLSSVRFYLPLHILLIVLFFLKFPSETVSNSESSLSPEELSGFMSKRGRMFYMSKCPSCGLKLTDYERDETIFHVTTCSLRHPSAFKRTLVQGMIIARAPLLVPFKAGRNGVIKVKVMKSNRADNRRLFVLDRETGNLVEEKIPPYIKLALRMIYNTRMTNKAINTAKTRAILRNMSINQGRKYDNPKSKKSIRSFVEYFEIDMTDVLEPIDNFETFNQFFYRKLKPGTRNIAFPDDPYVAVSPADCRATVFQSIDESTKIWIKGKHFSLSTLLKDENLVETFTGGAIGIFRLAPQDYHRFHIPVDGRVGRSWFVDGSYYTVNPVAINRANINVFGDNKRVISELFSEQFGEVCYVSVGATLVGSIILTTEEGQEVRKGDEHGYFAFGGSTIILLFQKGTMEWDPELIANSQKPVETLIKMGSYIGRHPDSPSSPPSSSFSSSSNAPVPSPAASSSASSPQRPSSPPPASSSTSSPSPSRSAVSNGGIAPSVRSPSSSSPSSSSSSCSSSSSSSSSSLLSSSSPNVVAVNGGHSVPPPSSFSASSLD